MKLLVFLSFLVVPVWGDNLRSPTTDRVLHDDHHDHLKDYGDSCHRDAECKGVCALLYGSHTHGEECCPYGAKQMRIKSLHMKSYCVGYLEHGDSCSHDEFCKSGVCKHHMCYEKPHVPLKHPGASCHKDHECKVGVCAKIYGKGGHGEVCCPAGSKQTSYGGYSWCTNLAKGYGCKISAVCGGDLVCKHNKCVHPHVSHPVKPTHPKPSHPIEPEPEPEHPVHPPHPPTGLHPGASCRKDHQCKVGVCAAIYGEHGEVCCPSQSKQMRVGGTSWCTNLEKGDPCKVSDVCGGDLVCTHYKCAHPVHGHH